MKEELTRQSIQLFERKGFSSTSVQDIVDSLGVTKGTFYYYFTSKETLLMDIHLSYIDDLLSRQQKVLNSNASCGKQLAEIVEMLINDIQTQGSNVRVYFREMRHLSEENSRVIKDKRRLFHLTIEQIIKEGIEKKEFRENLEPKMTTFAILGVTNWSYEWFDPSGNISPKELATMYMDFILHGIDIGGMNDECE